MQTRFAVALCLACLFALAPYPGRAAGDIDRPQEVDKDPDYAAGKKAFDAKDWNGVVNYLTPAAQRSPDNADIQNLLGYAYRKLGRLELAFKYYGRALEIDPRHRGAHEYVGVAYLMVNDLPKAEEHLAALGRICFLPCEEYNDLKRAIADYKRKNAK